MPDHAVPDPRRDATWDDPSPDQALYFALNPDLAAAFDAGVIRSAAEHWRDCGRDEAAGGARPSLHDRVRTDRSPADPDRQAPGLDADGYLGMNPDLRAVFGEDRAAATRHWVEHGSLEGRFGAGDAPYRGRAPDLAALLARPFGVDLYLPASEHSLAGAAGRRLLAALRHAGIPSAPRPYAEANGRPQVTADEAARRGTFRVSLLVASPHTLRRLHGLYPTGHFDPSYVVGYWPEAALDAHVPLYPTFGATDEVWVASPDSRHRLAAVAPLPVRTVELDPSALPPRWEARQRLGLPTQLFAVLVDGELADAGPLSAALAIPVADALAAFRSAFGDDPAKGLIIRTAPDAIASTRHLTRTFPTVFVLADRRQDGASLLLAAADVAVGSDRFALDRADAVLGGRPVLEPATGDTDALARLLAQAATAAIRPSRRPPAAIAGDRIAALLSDLGLRMDQPPFARSLGRSRTAHLPAPLRAPGRPPPSPDLPVLSILLGTPDASTGAVKQLAADLAAQPYPCWELCAAPATHPSPRWLLPADPRLRLADPAPRTASSFAATINHVAVLATGTHLLLARSVAEASAIAERLEQVASHLGPDLAPDILLAGPWPTGRDIADRIEAGGPAVRPVSWKRSTFVAAGGLPDRRDPTAEYALLLALRSHRAVIAIIPGRDAPARDPEPPDAAEAGRLALSAHLRATTGPLAYATAGLTPFTHRRRTHLARPPVPTVLHLDFARQADGRNEALPGEHLVFLEPGVQPAPDALLALLERLAEDEIGVVGGRVRDGAGLLHHAGLHATADGHLLWPGRGEPDDPDGPCPEAFISTNPDAVGGGVIAVRRSVLLQLGGFDRQLQALDGATFDLLAADLCRRATASGLRVAYTPFAAFTYTDAPPPPDPSSPAAVWSSERWRAAS